jgi:hypothetical protein
VRRARTYAAVYALGALLLSIFQVHGDGYWPPTLPWMVVCCSAAGLGVCAAARRPMTLLSAGHAGLTITWAGLLAPGAVLGRHVEQGLERPAPLAVILLLVLSAGMAGLIGIGLRYAPRAAAATAR